MAKEKRSAADLDAELAALEAELAALEGKSKRKGDKPPKAEKPAKAVEAPAPKAAALPPPAEAPAPAAPEKKGRFSMPKLGKKKAEPAPVAPKAPPAIPPTPTEPTRDAPAVDDTPVEAIAAAPQRAFGPDPAYDLSLWRQEGDAWIRVVPETPLPVMRRILDENGNVVREGSAEKRDVENVGSVRAERGLGRLLRRKG